jgi:hypothetical protein
VDNAVELTADTTMQAGLALGALIGNAGYVQMREAMSAATSEVNAGPLQAAAAAGMLATRTNAPTMRRAVENAVELTNEPLVQAALVYGDLAGS